MASRKKSDSGAYMSAYDNEVEAKIKALVGDIVKLQAEIATLKEHQHDAPATVTVPADTEVAGRVQRLVDKLSTKIDMNGV